MKSSIFLIITHEDVINLTIDARNPAKTLH